MARLLDPIVLEDLSFERRRSTHKMADRLEEQLGLAHEDAMASALRELEPGLVAPAHGPRRRSQRSWDD